MGRNSKILVFAGSNREKSFNRTLAQVAANYIKTLSAEVTYIELKDFPLPIMDQDLESKEGVPENAKKLKALMAESDGFIIASPEYNSAITPLLKNTIDWASRKHEEGEAPLKAFRGKAALLLAASPGALGGLRGLSVVRSILQNMGVIVFPQQLALVKASDAFDEKGSLKDAKLQSQLEEMVKNFIELLNKLIAP